MLSLTLSCNPSLKVLHLASGDRWAGAEVQLYTLLTQLCAMPDVEPIAVLLNNGELAHRLRAQHIEVEILDENRLSSVAIFAGIVKLLHRYKPDILHTHRQKENILGALANLLSLRAPSIRTVHGANEYNPVTLPQRLIQALDRWTGNHLQQRIIAVSVDLAEQLRLVFAPDLIVVIENGVDIDTVRAAVKPVNFREEEPDAVHVGIIGRLDPVKRVDIFLDMAKLLLEEQPQIPWRFHIFGEGALEASLRSQTLNLDIVRFVTFHGHRNDIEACLAGLNILVMCSDHEGLPMTLLEGLAVGTPIVAHAVKSLCELLNGSTASTLVAEHTPAAYAIAVRDIQKKNRYPRSLSAVDSKYLSSTNAYKIHSIYKTLKETNRFKAR